MHTLEIIIFAIIAVFLVIKLFSVLGQKNDNSFSTSSRPFDDSQKQTIKDVEIIEKKDLSPEEQIKLLDPNFSPKDFTNKAKLAYEIVTNAYADGDTHALAELVDISIMRELAYNITQRDEKKHALKIKSLKNRSEKIKSINIENSIAKIHLIFESEIIFYLEDEVHKIIKGSKTKAEKISQELCFTRNLNSNNPTWRIEKLSNIPF